jgi:hypothetical protein
MAITKYEAAFTTSEGAEFIAVREYARPLAYAWRVEYTANQICSVKFGFSATKEAAEKSLKLPKRCTVTHSQVVEAKAVGTVASKAKAPKAKTVKPCTIGETVEFILAGVTVSGRVAKLGRKFAYVEVSGAMDFVKIAFKDINPQSPETQPLAQAA